MKEEDEDILESHRMQAAPHLQETLNSGRVDDGESVQVELIPIASRLGSNLLTPKGEITSSTKA